MTDQPPARPPDQPSGNPAEGSPSTPPTRPMPAAGPPVSTSPARPGPNAWRQATSTAGGRWAIGIAAGAVAVLMLLGVLLAGALALRGHDRVAMMGSRQDGFSRDQGDQGRRGDGQGPDARDRNGPRQPGMPGAPGMRDGRELDLGGLGGLLGRGALHGNVSATVNGSVQALVFQRGAVTAVSSSSITLKSSDGFTGTYRLTAATSTRMGTPAKGGQVFVLARAADKVALTTLAVPDGAGVAPGN
jgi:hypothetical protein